MKTDKVKGLRLYTETVGTVTYIKCETDKGDQIIFPHAIKPVREVFNKVVEILSRVNWEGIDISKPSAQHEKAYREARFETSKL